MLVQTDKFGTSVAQSLRVHSETLRTKRRQRAEEAAAKTGVKMVFPLVFCIFPAIWVVTHRSGGDQVRPGPGSDGAAMTPAASTSTCHARPGAAAPVTLEDTGLGADRVEQLLIKTLYSGEATGAGAGRSHAPAVSRSSSRSSSARAPSG